VCVGVCVSLLMYCVWSWTWSSLSSTICRLFLFGAKFCSSNQKTKERKLEQRIKKRNGVNLRLSEISVASYSFSCSYSCLLPTVEFLFFRNTFLENDVVIILRFVVVGKLPFLLFLAVVWSWDELLFSFATFYKQVFFKPILPLRKDLLMKMKIACLSPANDIKFLNWDRNGTQGNTKPQKKSPSYLHYLKMLFPFFYPCSCSTSSLTLTLSSVSSSS